MRREGSPPGVGWAGGQEDLRSEDTQREEGGLGSDGELEGTLPSPAALLRGGSHV